MFKTITLLSLIFVAITIAPRAHAQQDPKFLSLGTLTITSQAPYPCSQAINGSKFLTNMTCQDASITCPNTDNISLTFGYLYTGTGTPQGTVVFLTGGNGTSPASEQDDVPVFANS